MKCFLFFFGGCPDQAQVKPGDDETELTARLEAAAKPVMTGWRRVN